jgi:hypothetical protein
MPITVAVCVAGFLHTFRSVAREQILLLPHMQTPSALMTWAHQQSHHDNIILRLPLNINLTMVQRVSKFIDTPVLLYRSKLIHFWCFWWGAWPLIEHYVGCLAPYGEIRHRHRLFLPQGWFLHKIIYRLL